MVKSHLKSLWQESFVDNVVHVYVVNQELKRKIFNTQIFFLSQCTVFIHVQTDNLLYIVGEQIFLFSIPVF